MYMYVYMCVCVCVRARGEIRCLVLYREGKVLRMKDYDSREEGEGGKREKERGGY